VDPRLALAQFRTMTNLVSSVIGSWKLRRLTNSLVSSLLLNFLVSVDLLKVFFMAGFEGYWKSCLSG